MNDNYSKWLQAENIRNLPEAPGHEPASRTRGSRAPWPGGRLGRRGPRGRPPEVAKQAPAFGSFLPCNRRFRRVAAPAPWLEWRACTPIVPSWGSPLEPRGPPGDGGDSIARRQEDALDFYQGKVLRIDLSAGTSAVEPLNMEWAEKYIGGKGLLLRYMWDEVPPKVDPWAPENPVILMTGPVRRHQRQHGFSPRRGLQEPADRHPQRQLRGRLVRPRDEVRRLRRHHHHRASPPSPSSSPSRTTSSSSCRPSPSTGA